MVLAHLHLNMALMRAVLYQSCVLRYKSGQVKGEQKWRCVILAMRGDCQIRFSL